MKRLTIGLVLASTGYGYGQTADTNMDDTNTSQAEEFWSSRHERRDLSKEIEVSEN